VTDGAIAAMAPRIGTRAACAAAGVPQASWYRRHRASPAPVRPAPVPHRDRVQPRALDPAERRAILDALHSERFADTAPAEAWAILLNEGTYLASVSTFYRVLRQAGESRERRAQAPGTRRWPFAGTCAVAAILYGVWLCSPSNCW
jgi:putative transposase